jgi:DNA-binding MurR/RpiR family transcriptional regulator
VPTRSRRRGWAASSVPILAKIEARFDALTRSERAIAAYLTANPLSLPFHTAASIAKKVGVSQMTVGRFVRSLGYSSFSQAKEELGRTMVAAPWLIGDRYERFVAGSGDAALARSLELEVKALMRVHELTKTAAWRETARELATAAEVFVAGFQTVRGAAMDFAARLEYVRRGVRFLDGQNGTYAEAFAPPVLGRTLLILDIRRYSKQARLLAQAAAEHRMPVQIVTDELCHWAREHSERVFHVATDVGLFWDSNASLTSLLNLLIEDVIRQLGGRVGERTERLEALQERFGAFLD